MRQLIGRLLSVFRRDCDLQSFERSRDFYLAGQARLPGPEACAIEQGILIRTHFTREGEMRIVEVDVAG